MLSILLRLVLLVHSIAITTRNDLFHALCLYRNTSKKVDKLKSDLSKTLSYNYHQHNLGNFINSIRNNYLLPDTQLSPGSRTFYSILSLPSYIELANQILHKSDVLIEFDLQIQSNSLLESLPDTHAKRAELRADAYKKFRHIKSQLTDGLPFSSVISEHLIIRDSFKTLNYGDSWRLVHKKACENQLVAIFKRIANAVINKVFIPLLVTTLSNLFKHFRMQIN